MEVVFQGFKEQIEGALEKSNIPREARLVIIGQLLYASERGDITDNEYRKLKDMLGKPEEFREILQLAHYGELLKPQSIVFTAEDFD
jgi:thiazole synthase